MKQKSRFLPLLSFEAVVVYFTTARNAWVVAKHAAAQRTERQYQLQLFQRSCSDQAQSDHAKTRKAMIALQSWYQREMNIPTEGASFKTGLTVSTAQTPASGLLVLLSTVLSICPSVFHLPKLHNSEHVSGSKTAVHTFLQPVKNLQMVVVRSRPLSKATIRFTDIYATTLYQAGSS